MFFRKMCLNNLHKTMSTSIVVAMCKMFRMFTLTYYSRFTIIEVYDHLKVVIDKHLDCESISFSYFIFLWTVLSIISSSISRFWTIYLFILFYFSIFWNKDLAFLWPLNLFSIVNILILTTPHLQSSRNKILHFKVPALCFIVFKLLNNNYC